MMHRIKKNKVIIIGGGPAGLMAAEQISNAGHDVHLFDAMPTVGRKFLLAGIGGLNLTHSEAYPQFVTRYREREHEINQLLNQFNAQDLQQWASNLGVDTFTGSSGRVFPKEMKAAPLLRSWLQRLKKNGVQFNMRHRWVGWSGKQLIFNFNNNEINNNADAVVFALGGASWPQLGSDGAWVQLISEHGLEIEKLKPSNCGFNTNWSDYFKQKFSGEALKSVEGSIVDVDKIKSRKKSQIIITENGVEGSLIYALSAHIRELIERDGQATLYLDLVPDKSIERVFHEVTMPRGSRSISSHLKSKLGLDSLKTALIYECLKKEIIENSELLAKAIKHLPITCISTRPIEEAISCAGGVKFDSLDQNLMSKNNPSIFFAGEMLDWEAPTGGYLLTACFASGFVAGLGVNNYLKSSQ
jgi:uncharacterized flavoprotein (TIGR03862 family)